MSRFPLICVLGLLLLGGCSKSVSRQTPVPAGWQDFSSDAGKFSVLLPGTPTEIVTPVHSEFGDVDAHDFNLKVVLPDHKAEAYMTSYSDFRPNGIAEFGESKFLELTWSQSFGKMPGPLVYKRQIAYQGHTALEFQMRAGPVFVNTSRMIISGDRLYMLTALMDDNFTRRGDATTYLDSLQIQ